MKRIDVRHWLTLLCVFFAELVLPGYKWQLFFSLKREIINYYRGLFYKSGYYTRHALLIYLCRVLLFTGLFHMSNTFYMQHIPM